MPWLDCDACGRWTHIPCERTHASLHPNLEGIKFSCAACRDKIQGDKAKKKLKARKAQTKQGAQKARNSEEGGAEVIAEVIAEREGLDAQAEQHSDPGQS